MPNADFSLADYIKTGSEAFVLLRQLYPLLPTQGRDEIEAKIAAAEEALQKANVELARHWEYSLCQCTFPPQIMLWQESAQADVCPNPKCGRREERLVSIGEVICADMRSIQKIDTAD